MDVTAATGAAGQTTPTGRSSSTSQTAGLADFDQFLNLFVSQLRYQDPLSPMDTEAFLAQTAQFSSVEQLVNLNKAVQEMAALSGSSNWANVASLIGRTVEASGVDDLGSPVETSGQVVRVDYGSEGEVLLGLEDGTTVPLTTVRSVAQI